ncbi:MAG TPA: DUF3105 domain-containing protein [Chloroflexota bacterium]|jgi:hypothetical protein|nr:DUF3105 domain-containing protein [Chloroflexota bacterium]
MGSRAHMAACWALAVLLAGPAGVAHAQALPGQPVPLEGAAHVPEGTPIAYQHYPPTSGPHYPRPARWAFYEAEVPEGYWVHNLEHGGIVFLYRCDDDCAARVAALRAVYEQLPPSRWGHVKALATPYSRLAPPLAAVAWGRIEYYETVDPERLIAFYRAFVDQGPEDVP